MRDKFRQFMMGRYGADQLGRFIMWVGLGVFFLSAILRSSFLSTVSLLILTLCYVRMFSKNINKRYNENQKYLNIVSQLKNSFGNRKGYSAGSYSNNVSYGRSFKEWYTKWQNKRMQKKKYHIYTCPTCKQKIRIPRGKGKICITCPKCHAEFIKRS